MTELMFERRSGLVAVGELLRQWAAAREQLATAERELADLDPAGLSDEELLTLLDDLETEARRRTAVGLELVAELDARGLAPELGYTSTAVLVSERLRIGRREAAGRVRLATDLGLRQALSGERLESRFPQVAAALPDGTVSARHANLIITTVDRLPDRVVDKHPELVAQVEPTLLEQARTVDPDQLAMLARRIVACLDPDGRWPRSATTSGTARQSSPCCRTGPAVCRPISPARQPRCRPRFSTAQPPGASRRRGAGYPDSRTAAARRAAERRATTPPLRQPARCGRHAGHRAADHGRGRARGPHRAGHHEPRRELVHPRGASPRRRRADPACRPRLARGRPSPRPGSPDRQPRPTTCVGRPGPGLLLPSQEGN